MKHPRPNRVPSRTVVLKHHFTIGNVDYAKWSREVDEQSITLATAADGVFEEGIRSLLAKLKSSHTNFYAADVNSTRPQHVIGATLRSVTDSGRPHWMFLDVFEDGPAATAAPDATATATRWRSSLCTQGAQTWASVPGSAQRPIPRMKAALVATRPGQRPNANRAWRAFGPTEMWANIRRISIDLVLRDLAKLTSTSWREVLPFPHLQSPGVRFSCSEIFR